MLLLFLTPILSSFASLFIPRAAFPLSLIPLVLLLAGVTGEVNYPWFPPLDVHFHLKSDGVSLLFLYLTAITIPLAILYTQHVAIVLLLQSLLIGFFASRDLVLFTLLWEAMLIPLFFLIHLEGGTHRKQAAITFLIYMIAGSILITASVLAIYLTAGSFDLDRLQESSYPAWAALFFFLAFAVKTPLFPFHAWLPEAYFEASTGGTILLSALLSKAGIYGFIRIGLRLFPTEIEAWSPLLLALAIFGVLWGAFAAWQQQDFKRLISYSSFSHVNFILAGLFVANRTAETGSILQAFNHGITITALFLVVDWLMRRLGSTAIGPYSGVAKYLPRLSWVTLFFVLSSVALPGMNNFIGELLILFGIFSKNPWIAASLGSVVIFSVVYMLRWMQKVYFEIPTPYQSSFVDIGAKEMLIALPLMALILWAGLYPAPILEVIR